MPQNQRCRFGRVRLCQFPEALILPPNGQIRPGKHRAFPSRNPVPVLRVIPVNLPRALTAESTTEFTTRDLPGATRQSKMKRDFSELHLPASV